MSGGRRLWIHFTIALVAVMCTVIYMSGIVVPTSAALYTNQSVVTRTAQATAQTTQPAPSPFPLQTAINGIPLPLVPAQAATPTEQAAKTTATTPLSGQVTLGLSPSQMASSATPSINTTPAASMQPPNLVTSNVTQPATGNGSVAPLGSLFGGGKTLLSIAGSSGTAVVVLATMLYWSFSYDEGTEPPLDVIGELTPLVATYSTIETQDYGQTTSGS